MSECSICLDGFEEDNCATLECGHSFHDQCIKVYKNLNVVILTCFLRGGWKNAERAREVVVQIVDQTGSKGAVYCASFFWCFFVSTFNICCSLYERPLLISKCVRNTCCTVQKNYSVSFHRIHQKNYPHQPWKSCVYEIQNRLNIYVPYSRQWRIHHWIRCTDMITEKKHNIHHHNIASFPSPHSNGNG